jgi:hypothetical protein
MPRNRGHTNSSHDLSSMMVRTTNDDQLFYLFLMFSYVYVNVIFNLNYYNFYGHEKSHVNFF